MNRITKTVSRVIGQCLDCYSFSILEESYFGHIAKNCQSPIEQAMVVALMFHLDNFCGGCFGNPSDRELEASKDRHEFWILRTQEPIGKYVVDIFLTSRLKPEIGIVIECDGHAFHEKTKKQAAHDKKRDREITLLGNKVFRFTGSEIYADTLGCVHQMHDVLGAEFDKYCFELWRDKDG